MKGKARVKQTYKGSNRWLLIIKSNGKTFVKYVGRSKKLAQAVANKMNFLAITGVDKEGFGVIYFIQQGDDGPIKIGRTDGDPRERLCSLQGANPYKLKILGCMRESIGTEQEMHHKFGKYRLQGEWFQAVPELMELIKRRCPANWDRKPNGYWLREALKAIDESKNMERVKCMEQVKNSLQGMKIDDES